MVSGTQWGSSDRDQQLVRPLVSVGSRQEVELFPASHRSAAPARYRAMLGAEGGPGHMKGSHWAVGAEMEQQQ